MKNLNLICAIATLLAITPIASADNFSGHLGDQATAGNVTNIETGNIENVMGSICNQSGANNSCSVDVDHITREVVIENSTVTVSTIQGTVLAGTGATINQVTEALDWDSLTVDQKAALTGTDGTNGTNGINGTDGKAAYVTTNADGSITVGIEGDAGQVATFVDTDTVRSDAEINAIANKYDDSAAINALAKATSAMTNDIANAIQKNTTGLVTLTDRVATDVEALEAADAEVLNDSMTYTDSVIATSTANTTAVVNAGVADSKSFTINAVSSVATAIHADLSELKAVDVVLADSVAAVKSELTDEAVIRKDGDLKALNDAKAYTDSSVISVVAAQDAVNNKLAGSTAALSDVVVKTSNESIDRDAVLAATINNESAERKAADVVLADAIATESTSRKAGDAATLVSAKTHTAAAVAVVAVEVERVETKVDTNTKSVSVLSTYTKTELTKLYTTNESQDAQIAALYAEGRQQQTAINAYGKTLANHENQLGKLWGDSAKQWAAIDDLKCGVASSAAMAAGAGMHTQAHNGKFTLVPSLGSYQGCTSVAIQSQIAVTDNFSVRVGIANGAKDLGNLDNAIYTAAAVFSW